MRKQLTAAIVVLCAPFVSACFNVEQRVKLNRDLSGEAAFAATMNLEPMAVALLTAQREMSGRAGDGAAKDLQDLLTSGQTRGTRRFPAKALLERMLPAGVRLLDSAVTQEGPAVSARFNFGFENVTALARIQMPPSGDAGPLQRKALEHPFPFDIRDEGSTLLLTIDGGHAGVEQKTSMTDVNLPPVLHAKLEDVFKGARGVFRLETPLEVVEHNATKRDGQVLLWEYDLNSLDRTKPQPPAGGLRVRLRKHESRD